MSRYEYYRQNFQRIEQANKTHEDHRRIKNLIETELQNLNKQMLSKSRAMTYD